MNPFEYEQHLRFMHLYNAALAAQEQETLRRSLRRMSRHNSYTCLPLDRSYPPPVKRADSSSKLERRKSLTRTSSAESGYNSNLEHRRQSRSLDRGLTKRSSTVSDSGTYEGYPRVRRVSVVKDMDNRPPTPPIIKRKGSSMRSNESMSPSVRFSTVEDIMSAYDHGGSWSGRYKPRKSIDGESYISAHSMNDYDRSGRRLSSASRGYDDYDGGRRSSRSHRKESSSSRRASVSSRRASVSSRRSSVASLSRRPSTSSQASYYDGPRMSIVNPHGIEGAEIMRRLSRASQLKEWERSLIMSRRGSKSSRRGSGSSRRRSTSSRRRSSVGYSTASSSDASSDSDSESDSDSSSSDSSGTSDSDSDNSSSSGSASDTESGSETEDSRQRNSSKSSNAPTKYGGNHANANLDSTDGGRTSQANGGMAFAMDGDKDWRTRESDASSSVCVIL